jgi:hypothetical protein
VTRPWNPDLQELGAAANDVVDTILGHSPNRLLMPGMGDFAEYGPRGPLRERMLHSLPTRLVRDFVERDIDVIDEFYVRTIAPDVALMRKFGSIDLRDQIAKINDEFNALSRGKEPAAVDALQKRKKADIRDILAMRDRIRGTYKLPDNPDGLLHRTVVGVKTTNYLSSLGTMTVSAISDVGKPVTVHGLTHSLATVFHPFVHGLKHLKLSAEDVKLAGQGVDMIRNDRVMSLMDLTNEYMRTSKFERGLSAAGRGFSFVTLMAPWNSFWKQLSGIISITRSLQAMEALVGGAASRRQVEYLASNGIEGHLAERILRQFHQHGGKHGAVWVANTARWTDPEAVRSMRSLISRDTNTIIVTPGAGDRPLWTDGDVGSLVYQFQSFGVASVQRTLIAGLQQRDANVAVGWIFMLGLGSLSYYLKTLLAGGEPSDDPAVWAVEAFDNSGLAGWIMNANNAIEKVTENNYGLHALAGEPARRFQNVNKLGAFFGPSVGKASDVIDILSAGTTGNWTAADTYAFRKLVPMQNLFYARWLFDRIENGTNEAFGIPIRERPGEKKK